MSSTTRCESRDVNKHTKDPVFSLTYRRRKLRAVIPKMFLFFCSAYISTIAYVSTPCRVETLKIDIKNPHSNPSTIFGGVAIFEKVYELNKQTNK